MNYCIRDPARRGPMGRSLKDKVEYRMRQSQSFANETGGPFAKGMTQAEARESVRRESTIHSPNERLVK